MSQFWQGVVSGSLPPTVPQQFTADDLSVAIPAAGNLNLFTNDTTENNINGIQSSASGSTVTTYLTNRVQGTVSTAGAVNSTVISFNLGSTPANFMFEFSVTGFDTTTPSGTSYWFMAGARTDGATATVTGTNEDFAEDVILAGSDVNMIAAGNVVNLVVTGVLGINLNWSAVGYYTRAT